MQFSFKHGWEAPSLLSENDVNGTTTALLEAKIELVDLMTVERSPAILYLFLLGSTNLENVCIYLQEDQEKSSGLVGASTEVIC